MKKGLIGLVLVVLFGMVSSPTSAKGQIYLNPMNTWKQYLSPWQWIDINGVWIFPTYHYLKTNVDICSLTTNAIETSGWNEYLDGNFKGEDHIEYGGNQSFTVRFFKICGFGMNTGHLATNTNLDIPNGDECNWTNRYYEEKGSFGYDNHKEYQFLDFTVNKRVFVNFFVPLFVYRYRTSDSLYSNDDNFFSTCKKSWYGCELTMVYQRDIKRLEGEMTTFSADHTWATFHPHPSTVIARYHTNKPLESVGFDFRVMFNDTPFMFGLVYLMPINHPSFKITFLEDNYEASRMNLNLDLDQSWVLKLYMGLGFKIPH